jgi:hypothetical protein
MNKILLLLLIVAVILTSCTNKAEDKPVNLQVFVVSEEDAVEMGTGFHKNKPVNTFVIGGNGVAEDWYADSSEKRQELREFRNIYEQKKEDFEAQKKAEFKHVRAVIDGKMIFGYEEGIDLDKSYRESLSEPSVKSDSIYADQVGKGGGFSE